MLELVAFTYHIYTRVYCMYVCMWECVWECRRKPWETLQAQVVGFRSFCSACICVCVYTHIYIHTYRLFEDVCIVRVACKNFSITESSTVSYSHVRNGCRIVSCWGTYTRTYTNIVLCYLCLWMSEEYYASECQKSTIFVNVRAFATQNNGMLWEISFVAVCTSHVYLCHEKVFIDIQTHIFHEQECAGGHESMHTPIFVH